MFVDASAIVAIMMTEPEAAGLILKLNSAESPITSPVAVYESVMAICRHRAISVSQGERDVRQFLALSGVVIAPIGDAEVVTALDAAARYGKGRGHPAQLNMGDCFTYAMARNHGRALLFTGDDFRRTDLRLA